MPVENENFVSRWSRRKQQVLQEESADKELTEASDSEVIIDPEVFREEKIAQLNALTDEDMPDLDTMDEGSDYSGFMSVNVSEGLRKIALKKLFQGKSFNVRDGLDEYDEDFTYFEKLDPLTITADMKHMVEVEAKRALAKEQQEEEERLLAEADGIEDFDDETEDDFADDRENLAAEQQADEVSDTEIHMEQNSDNDNEEVA